MRAQNSNAIVKAKQDNQLYVDVKEVANIKKEF
jgi:hypothetical protein